jgi:hypothetical protein
VTINTGHFSFRSWLFYLYVGWDRDMPGGRGRTEEEKGRHKKVLNLPGVFGTMSKCVKKPGSDRKRPKERS